MKILIILAHPDTKSFNHAIANTCRDRLIANHLSFDIQKMDALIDECSKKGYPSSRFYQIP